MIDIKSTFRFLFSVEKLKLFCDNNLKLLSKHLEISLSKMVFQRKNLKHDIPMILMVKFYL